MQEIRVGSLGQEDPLEKAMATHSSLLAWRIPWTEEPGGLQSRGSHSWAGLSDWTHYQKDEGWTQWFINSLQLCLGRIATVFHAPHPTSHPTVVSGLFANRIHSGSVGGAGDLWIGLLGLGSPDSSPPLAVLGMLPWQAFLLLGLTAAVWTCSFMSHKRATCKGKAFLCSSQPQEGTAHWNQFGAWSPVPSSLSYWGKTSPESDAW